MKKLWPILMAAASIALLSGCGGGGGPSQNVWTQEKQNNVQAREAMIQQAITANPDFNSLAGRQQVAATLTGQPGITSATVSSDGSLVVRHAEGIEHIWAPPMGPEGPSDRNTLRRPAAQRLSTTRGPVGSTKVFLINALSEDVGFSEPTADFDKMASVLENANQEVTRINGADVTPDRLKQIRSAGLIVYLGHGGGDGDEYAVQTGQTFDSSRLQDSWNYLTNKEIAVVTVDWGERVNGQASQRRDFFAIKPRFFQNADRGTLSKGAFICCACSGSKSQPWIDAVRHAGAAGYTGYSDVTNTIAVSAARSMVASMAIGKTLQESIDLLPYEDRHTSTFDHQTDQQVSADLLLSGDGTLRLQNGSQYTTHLRIDSPLNQSTVTTRVISLRGAVINPDQAWRLSVELNGTLSRLQFDGDGNFEQQLGVKAGLNTLKVSLDTSEGREVQQFQITGDFPPQDLYTEMTWDTDLNDIDVHLLPTNASAWTSADCYFGNKTSSFGASLDVDDVNGRGPEHITGTTIQPGTYRLFIHYWSTHGQTSPVRPHIQIDSPAGSWFRTCPVTLSQVGQVWEVGQITYPGGAFVPNDSTFVTSSTRGVLKKEP